MYNLTKKPATLQKHIEKYENFLKREKRMYGAIDDSNGLRYLLGPMYLAIGDIKGAIKSFRWFERQFPDDVGDVYQYFCWVLALYRNNNKRLAKSKLISNMFQNLYLYPCLFAEEQSYIDIWYSCNTEESNYLQYAPVGIFDLWQEDEKLWAKKIYYDVKIRFLRERYIEIFYILKDKPRGAERSDLLREASEIKYSHKDYLQKQTVRDNKQ